MSARRREITLTLKNGSIATIDDLRAQFNDCSQEILTFLHSGELKRFFYGIGKDNIVSALDALKEESDDLIALQRIASLLNISFAPNLSALSGGGVVPHTDDDLLTALKGSVFRIELPRGSRTLNATTVSINNKKEVVGSGETSSGIKLTEDLIIESGTVLFKNFCFQHADEERTIRCAGGETTFENIVFDGISVEVQNGASAHFAKCKIENTATGIMVKKGAVVDKENIEAEVKFEKVGKHYDFEREAPYTCPITGMEFVFVKGGCYQMGDIFSDDDSDEKPVHEACVNDFYIGKYEVTQEQWQAVMGNNPSFFKNSGDACPVEQVSWNDVQEFIRKLNEKIPLSKGSNPLTPLLLRGSGLYRLPTEAEWEYAARSGGKSEKYSGGNNIDSVAWYDGNSCSKTHPVGTKAANGLGIYDMSGNVWEWCQDWYGSYYYKNSPRNNPTGLSIALTRVLRGGSWHDIAWGARTVHRGWNLPDGRSNDHGFRLARTK